MARTGLTQAHEAWVAGILALLGASAAQASPGVGIVPLPAEIRPGEGAFSLDGSTAIDVPSGDADAAAAARYLSHMLERSHGLHLDVRTSAHAPAASAGTWRHGASIEFRRARNPAPEGYVLGVSPGGVRIEAQTAAGLFYGAVTLWQLAPSGSLGGLIPAQLIRDQPAYAWRGLMLDSARHFQSAAFIESVIEWMAWHKLNVLHWHLTDDQGWRLEIKRYPRLTDIGAWRTPASAELAGASDGSDAARQRYGGFYTQRQVRDIVAFAASRRIRIVPEIEIPGHAQAAIAAYPELGSIAGEHPAVSARWGVHPYLFNLEPATFAFLESVLDEVMALFPSREIHIGGDEAVKDQWTASSQVMRRMRALGIADVEHLQPYFTQQIARFLARHGRRAVGWDEILAPGLERDAIVMSWHGASGAHAAVLAGNDAVLAPAPTLYFDNRQSRLASEPPGRVKLVSLEDVYRFEPRDPTLTSAQRAHVLGVQGNVWTEHISTEDRLEWMALPRALAVAEIGWTAPERRSWDDFLARLQPTFLRERALGVRMADSVFAIAPELAGTAHGIQIKLSDQASLPIHYTLDGSEPRPDSPVYSAALEAPYGAELRAATFSGEARLGLQALQLEPSLIRHRDSRSLELCSEGVPLLLESSAVSPGQGPIFALDILNPCWIYRRADLGYGVHLSAAVAPLPFNFELGPARSQVRTGTARTRLGELEVHLDSCEGELLANLPLAAPRAGAATASLQPVALPARAGAHDLCLRIARPHVDPLWALDWVEVEP